MSDKADEQNERIKDQMRKGERATPNSDRIKKELTDEANRPKGEGK